jgi:hypothetical protein
VTARNAARVLAKIGPGSHARAAGPDQTPHLEAVAVLERAS